LWWLKHDAEGRGWTPVGAYLADADLLRALPAGRSSLAAMVIALQTVEDFCYELCRQGVPASPPAVVTMCYGTILRLLYSSAIYEDQIFNYMMYVCHARPNCNQQQKKPLVTSQRDEHNISQQLSILVIAVRAV
jgi:hypothetical protein